MCAFPIDFVGELVEYIKEHHKVASDTEMIWEVVRRLKSVSHRGRTFVDKRICKTTKKC
jgi:hypothetical protein